MSRLRVIHSAVPLLALLIACPRLATAQRVRALVDSQHFVFQARTAQPLRGPSHNITTFMYTLTVAKDRVISDLPYFGRAYVAPIDPTKNALEFTLNRFDYQVVPGKKEGWNIVIKPKDPVDIQQLQLNISSAGYATLSVISTNRDAISFEGVITPPGRR